jgi:hypothetical protein
LPERLKAKMKQTGIVIDNITLQIDHKAPFTAQCGPIEWNGIIYSPKYKNGQLIRLEGHIKNILIMIYAEKTFACNSLHKYYHHGNNCNDFYSYEIRDAIEKLNSDTGLNWNQALVKKMEYGVNVKANSDEIIESLISFKGKDYLPMHWKGKKYGAVCEFEDYRIKGYNKTFEVKQSNKIDLKFPLFRWEVSLFRIRGIENKIQKQLKVANLIKQETLKLLAEDSISKFVNTIRMQKMNLTKLSASQKKSLAGQLNPLIREDLKIHNRETHKRDRRIYRSIMADKSICINDDTDKLIMIKFAELIDGKK